MSKAGRVADPETVAELARFEAQKMAFAPLMFQALRVARDRGVFDALYAAGRKGVVAADIHAQVGLPVYAVDLLLEAALVAGFVAYDDVRYYIRKAGVFWLKEPAVRVNTDFSHYVCYRAFFHFEEALRQGLPLGLTELGPWNTLYEGLASLAPAVRDAWFAFDNYYSDEVFSLCLDRVFARPVERIIDVGANVGKFAKACVARNEKVCVAMVDLPQQLTMAAQTTAALPAEQRARIAAFPANVLMRDAAFPGQADVVWMSQFLDCFAPEEIVSILKRARDALRPGGRVMVLELLWNRQRYESAKYCVVATSLYFACIANGNSRMYHSEALRALIVEAGLQIVREDHEVGLCHSLLECEAAPAS